MSGAVELQRLCAVLALAKARRGRLAIGEAAAVLGVDVSDVDALADALVLIGVPPYGGGDYLDVQVLSGEFRVAEDLRLSQPMALAPADAPVLVAALRALLAGADPALASHCRRAIDAVLEAVAPGPRSVVDAHGRGLGWSVEAGSDEGILAACRRAVAEGRTVRLRYWNGSRGDVQDRSLVPKRLVQHTGRWYLVGEDVGKEGERRFRVDRVLSVEVGELVGARGQPERDRTLAAPHHFSPPPSAPRATIRVEPSDVPAWSTALVGVESVPDQGGGVFLTLPMPTEVALLRALLIVDLPFEIVAPPTLRAAAERWLQRVEDMHGA